MLASERLQILDILRGFAIFGILAVNITNFAIPNHDFGQMNFSSAEWYNQLALWINTYLIEGKFYVIFSFLFGIGFSVQLNSIMKKGGNLWQYYPRRLAILFIIGLLHALLWWGDVLRLYAILGFILFLIRNWTIKSLFILMILSLGLSAMVTALPHIFGNFENPTAQTNIFSSLSFALLHMAPSAFAMFLLGRIAGKIDLFQNIHQKISLFKKMIFIGLITFIILKLLMYFFIDEYSWQEVIPKTISDIALSSVYIAILCLFSTQVKLAKYLTGFANVGRMALTNYIMHTLICVPFFIYFNLAGKVESASLLLMTLAIFLMQILLSTWWLKHFHYGPIEWAWRSLTLAKMQKFAKSST